MACLMLNRPLLNNRMGLKAPGSMGTLFMDQVNIIEGFYASQKDYLDKFGKKEYNELQQYLDSITHQAPKIETSLQYINICDHIYKESISLKILQLSNGTLSSTFKASNAAEGCVGELTSESVHLLDLIDHELNSINFLHVSMLCKAAKFNASWINNIKSSLTMTYKMPVKQMIIDFGIFERKGENQRDLYGFLSYIQVTQFLKTLHFKSLKLRNDEIEYTLFQFVYLKLSEYQKKQERDLAEQNERVQKDIANHNMQYETRNESPEAPSYQQRSASNINAKTVKFMERMKSKVGKNAAQAQEKQFNQDIDDVQDQSMRRNASLQPKFDRKGSVLSGGSDVRKKKHMENKNQSQLRQNLYNWKFSICDLFEILLVIVFNGNLRRYQILYELVAVRSPQVFNALMANINGGGQSGVQQVGGQQFVGAPEKSANIVPRYLQNKPQAPETQPKPAAADSNTKLTAWQKIEKNIQDKQGIKPEEPKMTPANVKACIEYLDKQCLVNPTLASVIFEQFLIHCVFTKQRLVRAKGQNTQQSSIMDYIGTYQTKKLNQLFNDIQPPIPVEPKTPKKKKGAWKMKPRNKVFVDESFKPFCICLQALFDYYITEHMHTLNAQIGTIFNKAYRSFLMHVNVFLQFISDFQVFQDLSSPFASQINNYAVIFKHIWKEMSGFSIDVTNKQEPQADSKKKYSSLSAERGHKSTGLMASAPNLNNMQLSMGQEGMDSRQGKSSEAQQLQQLEVFEKTKTYASYLVFSDFFEILFKMAIYSSQDNQKSDMLKFKEFLQKDVFSNLKFILRLKKSEEGTKPHKAKVFKLLNKFHKVQTQT